MIELMEGRLNFLKRLSKLIEENLEKEVYADENFKSFQEGVQVEIKDEIAFLESLLERGKENED